MASSEWTTVITSSKCNKCLAGMRKVGKAAGRWPEASISPKANNILLAALAEAISGSRGDGWPRSSGKPRVDGKISRRATSSCLRVKEQAATRWRAEGQPAPVA